MADLDPHLQAPARLKLVTMLTAVSETISVLTAAVRPRSWIALLTSGDRKRAMLVRSS